MTSRVRTLGLVVGLVFLASCGTEDDAASRCGDHVCDPEESHESCFIDCRCPICPAGFYCQYPGVCAREPRGYRFTIDEASLPATRSDGSPWDSDVGADAAPDPYAILTLEPSAGATTTTLDNTFEPRWTMPSVEYTGLGSSTPFTLEVFDEDGDTDELVFTCSGIVSVVPLATFGCMADGGTVHVQIGP